MKIGLDIVAAPHAKTYSQHLAKVLQKHAPEHEYIIDKEGLKQVNLYHCLNTLPPMTIRQKQIPTIITVSNLNFIRFRHLYNWYERLFELPIYRRSLQHASRIITLNEPCRQTLASQLHIAPEKIDVIVPLLAAFPTEKPTEVQLEKIAKKYSLPTNFILMLGVIEPSHHCLSVLMSLVDLPPEISVVICGRKTAYAEQLLAVCRRHRIATRVEFIYELDAADLPALFHLAEVFAYLPDESLEVSAVPIVEAMRCAVPMLLSDHPIHREIASDAADYVDPESVDAVADSLLRLLSVDVFRQEMQRRERKRAELFSELAVAQRLLQIYNEL